MYIVANEVICGRFLNKPKNKPVRQCRKKTAVNSIQNSLFSAEFARRRRTEQMPRRARQACRICARLPAAGRQGRKQTGRPRRRIEPCQGRNSRSPRRRIEASAEIAEAPKTSQKSRRQICGMSIFANFMRLFADDFGRAATVIASFAVRRRRKI